jgi:glycosyltransferase involved in cell wall biosynthesis
MTRALSNNPRVTVVTPTFNRADFLPETIESVLMQDYPNLELLVLDDGSTDDTPALLESYATRYPQRVRWTRHVNMGQAKTLNCGFEMASGELLCILNSDDLLLDGAITRLTSELVSDGSAIAAYPDFRVIDESGGTIVELLMPPYSFEEMARSQNNFLGPGVIFTKEMALQLHGWDPSYRIMPDFDFWMRGALLGPYLHVPIVLASLRRHTGSITVEGQGAEAISERFRFIESFYDRPDLPDDIASTRADAYRNLYIISGISMLPEFNRAEDRFVIHDRLAWASDSGAVGRSVESELLAERERANRLQAALNGQVSHVDHLQSELALRDAEVQERTAVMAAQKIQKSETGPRTSVGRMMSAVRRRFSTTAQIDEAD